MFDAKVISFSTRDVIFSFLSFSSAFVLKEISRLLMRSDNSSICHSENGILNPSRYILVSSDSSFEFDIALLAILLPLIVSGVADRIFLQGAAREAEQAALTARFETLKARLSPHFLFNSLNTLVDIVEEDPKLAVKFIEEMAAIYRYILEHRDSELVPLSAEIEAIRALMHLLESRRPGAFEFEFMLAPGADSMQIVPLALQTVVENALKHNSYSASAPMKIKVFTDEDQLVVENTLNRRANVSSTATGLESLRKRVNHICRRSISVSETSELFSVRVPLVKIAAA